ncbi:hypothetical protein IM697_14110 [Streptomyces ferrugineus]|uniref:Uncharacterized protein n=1 Tax=Streptomyces ferrugineus TaxID=1413221 RepID=A0A7M2SVW8_9ACTN|nr:hypothetical protein [Streptomyces ferrugineus]QOV39421.1 hypothetical protein IM697_14110 [Streptomyces ferrugineus]
MPPVEVEQPAQHVVRGTPLAGAGPVRRRGMLSGRLLPAAALALYGQTGGGQAAQQRPVAVGRRPGDDVQRAPALGGVAQQVVHARRVGGAVGVR